VGLLEPESDCFPAVIWVVPRSNFVPDAYLLQGFYFFQEESEIWKNRL